MKLPWSEKKILSSNYFEGTILNVSCASLFKKGLFVYVPIGEDDEKGKHEKLDLPWGPSRQISNALKQGKSILGARFIGYHDGQKVLKMELFTPEGKRL